MKIIDLFNKIANGEDVPKKIKYRDKILKYFSSVQDYMYESNNEFLFANIFGMDTRRALNHEVEIIEEEKGIQEMECAVDSWFSPSQADLEIIKKLNELIKEVNKLKRKENN